MGEFGKNLRTLMEHRELVTSMIVRQIYARYKQSAFGTFWAVLKPLVTVAIFTIVFSVIAKLPSDGLPYPLFAFGALLPWTLFSTGITAGIPSLANQANLVAKIYFPREILPIAAIAASVMDFVIAFAAFIFVCMFYQVEVTSAALWIIPIVLITLLFTIGLSLALATVNVWYRDVGHASSMMVQLWMYFTPIIYPLSMVPEEYRAIYSLNPMVGIVEGFRNSILKGIPPDMELLFVSTMVSVVTFYFGYQLFKAKEFEFADVI